MSQVQTVGKCPFKAIYYNYNLRTPSDKDTHLEVIGLDSESDYLGRPFLFALSDGNWCKPNELLETLFAHEYRGKKFVCWNLKYDEGSILHEFPTETLRELWKTGTAEYHGYRIRSIPRKELVITNIEHKHSITFYDIAQFYAMTLDLAATTYLGKTKNDLDTKTFTQEYINGNWDKLVRYCIKDAQLTQELADLFITTLNDTFNVYPTKLYSLGYIAGLHFGRTCVSTNVRRFYRYYKECLEYAYLSYAGGKFETYQRGFGTFYQYDINSAYPYEIANLRDIQSARVFKSTEYEPTATYGFIKCKLLLSHDYSPIPLKIDGVNRYPIGSFSKVITKQQYDFLVARGDHIEIINAWWIVCQDESYPYKAEVERLFAMKAQFKGKNLMLYHIAKYILNAFYGKHIQVTPKHRKNKAGESVIRYEAGWLFNPIYASVITANTRLRLCEVCDKYDKHIVGVHTDSVITTIDLRNNGLNMGTGLGQWNLENEGYGVVVGSGVYQIGSKVHFRGFHGMKDLLELVQNNPNKLKLPVTQQLVIPWRLMVFRNAEHDTINRFTATQKILNLNFDRKREWESSWDWTDRLVSSEPFIEI